MATLPSVVLVDAGIAQELNEVRIDVVIRQFLYGGTEMRVED